MEAKLDNGRYVGVQWGEYQKLGRFYWENTFNPCLSSRQQGFFSWDSCTKWEVHTKGWLWCALKETLEGGFQQVVKGSLEDALPLKIKIEIVVIVIQ